MDFDILIPGHGPLGTKQDAVDHRQYLEDLYDAVLEAARAGQSLEEMKTSSQYEAWRQMNIEGMYDQIQLHRHGN